MSEFENLLVERLLEHLSQLLKEREGDVITESLIREIVKELEK